MSVTIARPHSLRGEIVSPGDKSVSLRAVIFNALSKPTQHKSQIFLLELTAHPLNR